MKRSLIIGITLLASVSLAACSSDSASKSNGTDSKSQSSKKTSSVTLANYNKVKLGSVTSGNGGTTKKVVKSMFGKPTITTETEVPGASKKATQYSWSDVSSSLKGATVNVDFLGDKVIGKGYVDSQLAKKVTDSQYKSVNTGSTVSSVKSKLGTPAGEALTGIGSTSSQVLMYTNGSKSISFTFSNDKLVTKSKTDLSTTN